MYVNGIRYAHSLPASIANNIMKAFPTRAFPTRGYSVAATLYCRIK